MLLRAFTSALSERDESVAAAAERCAEGGDGAGVRNFTEEVLKLKVMLNLIICYWIAAVSCVNCALLPWVAVVLVSLMDFTGAC